MSKTHFLTKEFLNFGVFLKTSESSYLFPKIFKESSQVHIKWDLICKNSKHIICKDYAYFTKFNVIIIIDKLDTFCETIFFIILSIQS